MGEHILRVGAGLRTEREGVSSWGSGMCEANGLGSTVCMAWAQGRATGQNTHGSPNRLVSQLKPWLCHLLLWGLEQLV